jgi:hypothetical protein
VNDETDRALLIQCIKDASEPAADSIDCLAGEIIATAVIRNFVNDKPAALSLFRTSLVVAFSVGREFERRKAGQ